MYDNSSLQAYKSCPESYRLKYIEQLKKREESIEEHDKNFGKAIHAGLEAHYQDQDINSVREVFANNYPEQLNSEDLAKTQENGLVLLEAYIKHYQEEDKKWTIKAVEVADTFEIAPGIPFTVKIDLVVEQQGCIYAVDHKTTGKSFNWNYWGIFEPNSQITAYTAYCQSKFGECSGVIINAMQLGYRQRTYKGDPAGFHYSFQRQLFNRNRQQIEAWKEDSILWIKRIEESKRLESISPATLSGAWMKNEGQCYYCSYKPICISCNDDQIKEQLFEKVNATEYLGDLNANN